MPDLDEGDEQETESLLCHDAEKQQPADEQPAWAAFASPSSPPPVKPRNVALRGNPCRAFLFLSALLSLVCLALWSVDGFSAARWQQRLLVYGSLQVRVPPIAPAYLTHGMDWTEPCSRASSRWALLQERCLCQPLSVAVGLLPAAFAPPTSCILPPPALLSQFFAPLVRYYPSQLTFRPTVDCQHGRYLLVRRFHKDGLGASLGSYNALLSLAAYLHLQLVEPPFESTHIPKGSDEAAVNLERRAKLRLFEWEVPRAQWELCSNHSEVKRNRLSFPEFSTHSWYAWSQTAAWSYRLDTPFNITFPFVRQHAQQGTGMTLSFDDWNGYHGCVHPTSVIHAVRRAVDHPRVRQRLPAFHDSLRSELIELHFHLRRGDLGRWNATLGEWEASAQWAGRMLTAYAWAGLMTQLYSVLPWSIAHRLRFSIWTEANHTVHEPVLQAIAAGQRASFLRAAETSRVPFSAPPVRFVDDDIEAVDGVQSFADGDIVITSPSDFSYSACMLNPAALKIGTRYSPHWHGCVDHLELESSFSPLPAQWRAAAWVPESVVAQHQRLRFANASLLLQRVEQTVDRVDRQRALGAYPYDLQPPNFIAAHSRYLEQQILNDVRLGLVQPTDPAVTELRQYIAEHNTAEHRALTAELPSYPDSFYHLTTHSFT